MAIYLDYNASGPIYEQVIEYMVDIYRHYYGNSSSRSHTYGTNAREIVEKSRKQIADILDIDIGGVIFTSGATESDNMAILGMIETAKKTGKNHFVTTSIEHKAVLEPMRYLERIGFKVDYVSPDKSGRIAAEHVLDLVTDKTLLVSIMHVNSETGIIQPIKVIGDALYDTKTWFHVDATQSFIKLNKEINETKYDLLSISSHKIRGPQGVGALIRRRDFKKKFPPLSPIMFGGEQEGKLHSGTIPVALVGGFALAAEISTNKNTLYWTNSQAIKNELLDTLKDIPYTINGDPRYCIPSTINISFENIDAERLFNIIKEDYAISNGSACASGSYNTSYVLKSMGLPESKIAKAVRLSWDFDTKANFTKLAQYVKCPL